MSESLEDLSFLAGVLFELDRFPAAISTLTRLIALKPVLSADLRLLFSRLFKKAVDAHRKTLRTLIANEADAPSPSVRDTISGLATDELDRLATLCGRIFQLIDHQLLPNAADQASVVFYRRARGDFSRYLCEFVTGEALEEAKADAERAYATALAAARDSLAPANPIRLGTVLNYAVFKNEHCQQCLDAAELLRVAVSEVGDGISALSDQSGEEAEEIMQVMVASLKRWGWLESTDEEEEEDWRENRVK
jgi:hypothetical protein